MSQVRYSHFSLLFVLWGLFFAVVISGCAQKSRTHDFQSEVFYPAGGPSIHLKEMNKLRPVLLVFWATWCEACREEIPGLNQLSKQYAGALEIISINVQEEPADVEAFLKETPLNYRVILDEGGELADRFEVTAIPSAVLLAKGGEILYYGFRLPESSKLEEALMKA